MKQSEFLTAARNRIAAGWIRHSMEAPAGVCLVGALVHAQRKLNREDWQPYRDALTLARKKIAEMWPEAIACDDGLPDPIHFNDDYQRTQQDILDVFDKAILDAQERGD